MSFVKDMTDLIIILVINMFVIAINMFVIIDIRKCQKIDNFSFYINFKFTRNQKIP